MTENIFSFSTAKSLSVKEDFSLWSLDNSVNLTFISVTLVTRLLTALSNLPFWTLSVATVDPRSLSWLPKVATLFDKSFTSWGLLNWSGEDLSRSWTVRRTFFTSATSKVKFWWRAENSERRSMIWLWFFWRSLDSEWHFCKASGTPWLPATTEKRKKEKINSSRWLIRSAPSSTQTEPKWVYWEASRSYDDKISGDASRLKKFCPLTKEVQKVLALKFYVSVTFLRPWNFNPKTPLIVS